MKPLRTCFCAVWVIVAMGGLVVGAPLALCAETTTETTDGVFVITVPPGETCAMTATMVAGMGSLPLAKRGDGTLTADDVMADYAGEIRVEQGVYKITTTKACGTSAGGTIVSSGATLWHAGGSFSDQNGQPYGRAEQFTFEGTGFEGQGAYRHTGGTGVRLIKLTGDTLFDLGSTSVDTRYDGVLDMEGHTLTVRMTHTNNGIFLFCCSYLRNMGNIVVEGGRFQLQNVYEITGSANNTVTLKRNGVLDNWNMTKWMPWTLVCEDGSFFRHGTGVFTSSSVWSGPIILNGQLTTATDVDWGNGFTGGGPRFYGKISGTGGITVGKGLRLRIDNAANDFTGPVIVQGLNAATNGHLHLPVSGAVPPTAERLELGANASVHLEGEMAYALPPLVARGEGRLTEGTFAPRHPNGKASTPSLLKTGDGTLSLETTVHVDGTVDVQGGGLRLPRMPRGNPGLKYYGNPSDNSAAGEIYDERNLPYLYDDPHGPSYAYRNWPKYYGNHVYTGYFFVDGTESVTWDFASTICRVKRLFIDGVCVLHGTDSGYSSVLNWIRFFQSGPVTLTPGWHSVKFTMYNYYNGTCGASQLYPADGKPVVGDPRYWKQWFGLGYDPQCRGTTNSNDYVAFTDPGDGSFLRCDMTPKEWLESEPFRGSFGALRMAGGTTLDVNDSVPYTPFPIGDFAGGPLVTNGCLSITNSWTVSPALMAAGPLTVSAGSEVRFAAGAKLQVEDVDLFTKHVSGTPVLKVEEGGTLSGRPVTSDLPKPWGLVASPDGTVLSLCYRSGMTVLIR